VAARVGNVRVASRSVAPRARTAAGGPP
jgi:hypothetical protein